MSDRLIKVEVRNTESVLYDGEVDRITAYNEVGKFDIYPMHANFISIILKELTLYKKSQLIKEIKLEKAIVKVKKDVVKIYLGIESLAIEDEMLDQAEELKTATTKPTGK